MYNSIINYIEALVKIDVSQNNTTRIIALICLALDLTKGQLQGPFFLHSDQ